MQVHDIEETISAVAGTSEAIVLEQTTDESYYLILREPALLARLMTWLEREDKGNNLRDAVLKIGTSETTDRVITASAILAAWEYHIAKGAQSTDLVCEKCGSPPEPVAMSQAPTATRTMAHLCTQCRRLIQPVERPPQHFRGDVVSPRGLCSASVCVTVRRVFLATERPGEVGTCRSSRHIGTGACPSSASCLRGAWSGAVPPVG